MPVGGKGPKMSKVFFQTETGAQVPAVTAEQMLEVDRLAMETYHLGILQMMENAGRNLAHHVLELITEKKCCGDCPRRTWGQWWWWHLLCAAPAQSWDQDSYRSQPFDG